MSRFVAYDYKCNKCDLTVDMTVEYEERDKVNCPICGETLTRLLSAPNFKRKSTTRSDKERAIKRDLIEASHLEESLYRGNLDKNEKTEVKKEIDKLKFKD